VAHPSEHARRVLDRLPASELDVVRIEEKHISAEFANADLKAHPRPRRTLGEHHRPALMPQRMRRMPAARRLHLGCEVENFLQLSRAERFD
jgi:hypothetical protein